MTNNNYIIFNHFKDTHVNSESVMNNYFITMKEEISIRIESVKAELDKLSDQLCKFIDDKNKKMKTNLEKLNNKLKDQAQTSQKFINNLSSLLIKTDLNSEKLEDNMYLCQDRIKELQTADTEFYKIFKQIKFKPNESELNTTIIGELSDSSEEQILQNSYNVNNFPTEIKLNSSVQRGHDSISAALQRQSSQFAESSESEVFEGSMDNDKYQALVTESKYEPNEIKIVEFAKKIEWPCGIHCVGDKDMIMTDNVNNEIIILNNDLQIVRHIKNVGEVTFSSPFGIASDEKDSIFVCDGGNNL